MSPRIVIVSGSPRKNGNTNALVQEVRRGAESKGAEVTVIDTAHLNYTVTGCTECMGCQNSSEYVCVIEDEASPLIASLPQYDVVIFATPVFFFGPTAQLKLFMDRMFSLAKLHLEDGKAVHALGGVRIGLIATAGGDLESGLKPVEKTFQTLVDFLGLEQKLESLLVPFAPRDPDELDKKVLEKAYKYGARMAESE